MPRSGLAASHLPHTLPSALHTSLVVEDVLHTTWTEINRPHVVPARAPATPLLPAKTPPEAHSDQSKQMHAFVSHFWDSAARQSTTAPNVNSALLSPPRRKETRPTQPAPHPFLQSATAARKHLATVSFCPESVRPPNLEAPLLQVRPLSPRSRPQSACRLPIPPAAHSSQPVHPLRPHARADLPTQNAASPRPLLGRICPRRAFLTNPAIFSDAGCPPVRRQKRRSMAIFRWCWA